jgi:phage/plasmid-associated DNA primase
VFKSDQGTGKNLFFENFGNKLLGKEYTFQTGDMERVIGRFANTCNKLLVILDEVSGKDGFRHSDKIKNLITADKLPWERKGIDAVSVRNCGRTIIFSNNEAPVKIEGTDRRFQVNECSNAVRNNTTYFKALIKAFNDEKQVKAFYNYLMSIDLSDWDAVADRPITQIYKDLKSVATPITVKFLRQLADDYHLQQETNNQLNLQAEEADEEDLQKLTASRFYNRFKVWVTESGHNVEMNSTRFGLQIKNHKGVSKSRTKRGVIYKIDYQELTDYLKTNYPDLE